MKSIVVVLALVAGVCNGAPTNATRIVGGSPVDISVYPHIVQNERNWGTNWGGWCAGTILASHIVLSAAHCFEPHTVGVHNYRIRAGTSYPGRGGTLHYMNQIIMSPNWENPNVAADGDICILRMRDFFVFGHTVQPIPILPQDFVIPHNSLGFYAGWGALGTNLPGPDHLHHVAVNIVSHEDCERRYGGPIHRDVVCAGYGGVDACQGDSGGPLYHGTVLAGVIAWGPEMCAHPYKPGAAMRTAYYSDWIVANSWF